MSSVCVVLGLLQSALAKYAGSFLSMQQDEHTFGLCSSFLMRQSGGGIANLWNHLVKEEGRGQVVRNESVHTLVGDCRGYIRFHRIP